MKPVPPVTQPPLKFHPAYNLFRRKRGPELFCAVPEDRPVPRFVNGKEWAFAGKADEPAAVPLGFHREAASTGVRLNGFYLFAAFPAVRDTAAVQRVRWAA